MTPRQQIAHYRITTKLGEGGMGEVWRATDTKLGREVAIKVLPEAFARDPDRMARFEREAKVLAALNHPNIAAIYGVEERALIMELVEGPTLADRILLGAIALEEALAIGKQVAEALEYAHEHGVVHRDLKPANIKVTPEGRVKVLDFGLAAVAESSAAAPRPADSPTLTMHATLAGVILGTAAYMSPEQARGQTVDKRADIWAFGVVLWEMLTGEPLFRGDTITDVLAAVVRHEPEWERVPIKVRRLLRKCLEKDPKKRLRDIGDVWELLEETLTAPSQSPLGNAPSRLGMGVMVALTILAIIAAAGWYRATRPAELKPLVRLDVDLGSGLSLGSLNGPNVIISPDGNRLVYASQDKLLTRRLDQSIASELAGTEGAAAPFFSPDGKWIGFYNHGKLQKVSVEGGTPIPLCSATYRSGASWGEDGVIIASLSLGGVLSRVPEAGGSPSPVTVLASGEVTHRWPQVLPGAKAVIYTASPTTIGYDTANINVVTLRDGRQKTLVRGGAFGRYLPSGHLIYFNRGTLFAVPFDVDKLEVRGAPTPVLSGVASNADGSAQFDFSAHGTLIYQSGAVAGGGFLNIQWLDGAGKTQALLDKPDNYRFPRLSPDGHRLALGLNGDIWIYDLQRDTPTRLTFNGGDDAVWSPDGRYIVFQGEGGMFWTRSDNAGKAQPLTQSKNQQYPFSFTPDGKRLAFYEGNVTSDFDIWTLPVESDAAGLRAGKPEVFLKTPASEWHPAFSPDGHFLAYDSNESGSYQVYVRAFPDKGGKWQISNTGGLNPLWARNGRQLFFRSEDSRTVMTANYVVNGDSFVPDKARVWAAERLGAVAYYPNYDVSADGKRIAALMPAGATQGGQATNQVIFLENFFDELRRRVPAGGK